MNADELIKSFHWRYATKQFDSTKKISQSDWGALEQSLHLAPSSYGLQPWKFFIVTSDAVKKKLTPFSFQQPQIETCSHLVVISHLTHLTEKYVQEYFEHVVKIRNASISDLKPYADMIIKNYVQNASIETVQAWCARQSYIAMGFFLNTAAMLQIDACPMEGIQAEGYNKILGIESPYTTASVIAAGYRAAADKTQHAAKVRFEKQKIFHYY